MAVPAESPKSPTPPPTSPAVPVSGPELRVVRAAPPVEEPEHTEAAPVGVVWREHLRPPDVWHGPIPSLAEQWEQWRTGAHLPDGRAARWVCAASLGLASLFGMAAVLAHWAAASPARLAVAGLATSAVAVVAATLISMLPV